MNKKLIFIESSGTSFDGKPALVLSTGYFNEDGNLIDSIRVFPHNSYWSDEMIVDLTKIPIYRIEDQSPKLQNRNHHV